MADTADIFDYENGDLSEEETVMLFAELVRSGLAWRLQGHYGRTAQRFLDAEWISPEGQVLVDLDEMALV
jgi:hypothetical protein